MIYENIEFFGAVELTKRFNGLQLQRIPELTRNNLNTRGRWNSQMTSGLEIRFVCDSPHIRLFLSSLEGDAEVVVFCGNFLHSVHHLAPGGPCCIHVEPPDRFGKVKSNSLITNNFSPNVWRFVLPACQTIFHELETYGAEFRPPDKSEKPALTWLTYGSSITAGCGAARVDLSYVHQTAHLLGVNVVNLAMGGACHCEPELVDFIAERADWDFATLEIGVNMRDSFSVDEFHKRSEYLIDKISKKNPGKMLFLITSFPNQQDYETVKSNSGERQAAYNDILRELVSNGPDNLILIEGYELMPDFSSLLIDLIHPSASGHIQIASKLADKLTCYLK